MSRILFRTLGLAAFGLALVGAEAAEAQFDRIKRTVKREVNKAVDEAVTEAVRCSLGDEACVEQAKKEGQPVVITDAEGNVVTDDAGNPVDDPQEAERRVQAPGEGVWRNYDFVPGDTVWRATDFSGEPVGRFPVNQLEFVKGNMQIVEFEGEKVLEISSSSVFHLKLPRTLPDDFSLEFMMRIPAINFLTNVYFSPLTTSHSRYPHDYLSLYGSPGVYRKGQVVSNISYPRIQKTWVPVKLQVDSAYAILYVGSERAAQVPTANFARSEVIEFRPSGNSRLRTYLKGFVVSVGLNKLYDALTTTGEYTTRGIFFDVDSDRLRPESTPVLEEIERTLAEHADLRIRIEGHTDSQGEAAYNQDLSERRARAVVRYLTERGIDGGRLAAEGKGESVPVADNATPEGRQQNRRVVIRLAT